MLNKATITPIPNKMSTINIEGTNLNVTGTGKFVGPSNSYTTTGAFWVQHSNTLNIDGNISVESGTNSDFNACVIVYNGTVNISNGYFHSSVSKDGSSSPCIYLFGNTGVDYANITGGVFEADGDAMFLINCEDTYKSRCHVKVMGGTFVGFNPADNTADGAHTNYVATGYKSVETTYNGKQAWKVVRE